jgi:hypothetical protein
MENTKFDITSTAIEKGIDLVAGFLEKLAGSSLEEAGLLLSDKIRTRRLKNQIKIFSEAKKIAEENNISIKQINLKILVPLLEFSSLEEDETLQQKWSNLIVNFSDSKENYESSIFPFILGQLSRNEIIDLDIIYQKKQWTRFGKVKLSPMHRSNFIRLGLVESVIYSTKDDFTDDIKTYNGGAKITELGKQFVECCTNKNK